MAECKATIPSVSPEEIVKAAWEEEPVRAAELIASLTDEHNAWHERGLNLIASHNLVSPKAKAIMRSTLIDNSTSGGIGSRSHTGGNVLDRIELLLLELTKKLFGVPYVEFRAPSGAVSNGLFIFAAMERGDRVVALPVKYGGHYSYRDGSYAGMRGVEFTDMPCYGEDYPVVNLELLAEEVERVRPRWVMVGSATSLFPYPLKEISEIAHGAGAQVFFDGAHILGLAVAGQFQDPLHEGAAVMTGSTQKTLGGPIGGLVLMNDQEMAERVNRMTPSFLASVNNSRTAALAVTIAEMLAFGREYAAAVVANAQALARGLDAEGFSVAGKDRGFTQSHVVMVDLSSTPGGEDALHRLEAAHIAASPADTPGTYPHKTAVRLGSPACTKLGMGQDEMREVARLMRRVVLDREDPDEVGRDVAELASGFTQIHYCF